MPQASDSNTQRAPSLSQRVVDGITQRIQSGELKPEQRVPPEPALMREFSVSRSVVREAVSRLQANGLIRTRHGVGSFVQAPQPDRALMHAPDAVLMLQQKLALLELRLSLESEAAALAAQRRTPEQLSAMQAALDAFDRQHSTGEGTAEADFRFHELIAQATGNEYFLHVLRSIGTATITRGRTSSGKLAPSAKAPRFGEPTPQLRSGKEITAMEHRAVFDAIARGDAPMARAAMYMHLNNSRDRMKATTR
ncbi:MAG: hypothetical protein RI972_158 [Pseudomonadota bacterium]|jgi:DNA-binding FadR family transcriptional regulator